MKKGLIIILSIFFVYIILRFIFSYTIFDIPDSFGRYTFVGGDKYDFSKCIVNPLRTKPVKEKILNYVEQILNNGLSYTDEEVQAIKYAVNYRLPYDETKYYKIRHYEEIKRFFHDSLNRMQDFDIVSVATSKEGMTVNKNADSFLLQQKENQERKCVVIIDKETEQIIRIAF